MPAAKTLAAPTLSNRVLESLISDIAVPHSIDVLNTLSRKIWPFCQCSVRMHASLQVASMEPQVVSLCPRADHPPGSCSPH